MTSENHSLIIELLISRLPGWMGDIGQFSGVIEQMYEWCRDDTGRPHQHTLRFMAHLILFFRSLDIGTKVCMSYFDDPSWSPSFVTGLISFSLSHATSSVVPESVSYLLLESIGASSCSAGLRNHKCYNYLTWTFCMWWRRMSCACPSWNHTSSSSSRRSWSTSWPRMSPHFRRTSRWSGMPSSLKVRHSLLMLRPSSAADWIAGIWPGYINNFLVVQILLNKFIE